MRCAGCFSTLSLGVVCPCGFDETTNTPVNVLPPGTRIYSGSGNTYLLGMVLGTGTFAIAYLAWDEMTEQRVAIKEFMPREICYRERGSHDVHVFNGNSRKAFDRGIEGFVKEAAILKTFDHPNIVTVLDFFRANSTAYLVMPYFDSTTLGEYLDRVPGGRLPPETAVEVMVAILDGLRHVHKNRVANRRWSHRDVKPSNILLRANHSPLLIDFGAARIEVSDRDKAYSVIVTPGYAPPEQYGGGDRSRGPWVDVYACAATLYQALTGVEPEDAPVRQDAVTSGEPDPLVPPVTIVPDIGQHVSDVVLHAMKLDYRQRPQDAEELKGMLLGEIPVPELHPHGAQPQPDMAVTSQTLLAPTLVSTASPILPPLLNGDSPLPPRKCIPTPVAVAAILQYVVLAGASFYVWDQLERTRAALGAEMLKAEESRRALATELSKDWIVPGHFGWTHGPYALTMELSKGWIVNPEGLRQFEAPSTIAAVGSQTISSCNEVAQSWKVLSRKQLEWDNVPAALSVFEEARDRRCKTTLRASQAGITTLFSAQWKSLMSDAKTGLDKVPVILDRITQLLNTAKAEERTDLQAAYRTYQEAGKQIDEARRKAAADQAAADKAAADKAAADRAAADRAAADRAAAARAAAARAAAGRPLWGASD